MLLSTFYFSIMNVFIKKVNHLPVMELVFFRCFISFSMCYIYLTRHHISKRGTNRGLLLARGITGTFALYLFFVSLHEMPLGTAVTIQYMSPIFTSIIAIFYLKEKISLSQWLFFIISFSGVLVLKGFDSRISMGVLLIGICSAFMSGISYNLIRSLKEKEHPTVVVLHFQLVGFIIGLSFTIFNWKMPVWMDWIYLAIVGVMTQLAQVHMTKAFQMERVGDISILNYLGAIYALIFGYFLFNELYSILSLLGIVLILGGVVMNYFYQKRLNRKSPAKNISAL